MSGWCADVDDEGKKVTLYKQGKSWPFCRNLAVWQSILSAFETLVRRFLTLEEAASSRSSKLFEVAPAHLSSCFCSLFQRDIKR